MQEWRTGKLIGVGREYRGLYYLTPPPAHVACVASDPPALLHRLGHPNLHKLQKMVLSLSGVLSLECVSC